MLLGMSRLSIVIKLTLKYHLLCGIYSPLIPPLTNLVLPGQSCECENTLYKYGTLYCFFDLVNFQGNHEY